jgi:hypothetical protein
MAHFYMEVVAGAACGVALVTAQRLVKKAHPHVLSWGAFICQGDPDPPIHWMPLFSRTSAHAGRRPAGSNRRERLVDGPGHPSIR